MALVFVPAAAQQRIDYTHRSLDCGWLLSEYRRLKREQDADVGEPLGGVAHGILQVFKGVLDVIGGQEEDDPTQRVEPDHRIAFSYRAQDIAAAMRIKSCAQEFSEVSQDMRSNAVPDQFRKPQSALP